MRGVRKGCGDLLFEQFVLSPDQLEVSPPDGGRPEPRLRVGVQVEDDLLPPGPLVPRHHPPHVLGVVRRERLDVHPGQLEEGGEPVRDEDQSEGTRVTFSNKVTGNGQHLNDIWTLDEI